MTSGTATQIFEVTKPFIDAEGKPLKQGDEFDGATVESRRLDQLIEQRYLRPIFAPPNKKKKGSTE